MWHELQLRCGQRQQIQRDFGPRRQPLKCVTFYDTLRFANWLDNGQTPGSTETGAYTL